MTDSSNPTDATENVVSRAAQSADDMLESTRRGVDSVIDGVADRVHAARDAAAPALDRLLAPVEALAQRTRAAPVTSLLVAASVGAALMALTALLRSSRR